MKNKLVEHIKDELAKGAIITQSIPLFLRDAFENPAERVLKGHDESVIKHIKTRPAPWIVKGSTDLSQKVKSYWYGS